MPHVSDGYDRGHHHHDHHPDYHRSRRERGRFHDDYNDRDELKTSNAARENHNSESSIRGSSETKHHEQPITGRHHRHSHSPGSPRENPESRRRGRSETRHHERALTHHHTRDSHSAEPPRDHRRHHSDTHPLIKGHDKKFNAHLAEKAIGTAATTAFRLRHAEGSWVGSKGLKVVGVAVATAAIDGVFDREPKKHLLRHTAVGMVQGAVMDAFATSIPLGK